jgi:hypothetical protein
MLAADDFLIYSPKTQTWRRNCETLAICVFGLWENQHLWGMIDAADRKFAPPPRRDTCFALCLCVSSLCAPSKTMMDGGSKRGCDEQMMIIRVHSCIDKFIWKYLLSIQL